jgi:hypothetical protein
MRSGALGHDGYVDALVGRALVAVERLSWTDADGSSDPRVGPVHIHFTGGRGAFLSGETDFTLGVLHTRTGDESWLVPYHYEIEGCRWVIRDATDEPPFEGFRGARLESVASVRNEMGEQVGMTLEFDLGTISLRLAEGEVAT